MSSSNLPVLEMNFLAHYPSAHVSTFSQAKRLDTLFLYELSVIIKSFIKFNTLTSNHTVNVTHII